MPAPTLHTPAIPVINVDADGNPLVSAPSGNPSSGVTPTLVAGSDGTNVRTIATSSGGAVRIATSGTSSWSGGSPADGVAYTSGMPVNSASLVYNGTTAERLRTASAADATTGTGLSGAGILGQYLATLPTYTTGQFGTLAMSNKGVLLTTPYTAPTAGTNLSGTATTTSGAFSIPASATRKPGDVQGQNVSAVTIGFNEFGGAAVIGAAGTYTVPAGSTFSITTNLAVNFIAASGTAPVTVTGV